MINAHHLWLAVLACCALASITLMVAGSTTGALPLTHTAGTLALVMMVIALPGALVTHHDHSTHP